MKRFFYSLGKINHARFHKPPSRTRCFCTIDNAFDLLNGQLDILRHTTHRIERPLILAAVEDECAHDSSLLHSHVRTLSVKG